jgi:pimeloyl-ACP methyl ester carboxylesterase
MHRDRILLLHGSRFHYTEWGEPSAAPVILLHGVTGHARTWDEEARALAARYRILALDQRGHGDSDPAPDGDYSTDALVGDVAALVETLALSPVRLVGLSLGGRVAIAFAARYPAAVERLVVVDIGPELAPAGVGRVGMLMASSPERFGSVDEAFAHARASNPRYQEAALRHRVVHAVRPLPDGGYAWKYDRAIRDAVRTGRWRDGVDLWPLWKSVTCPTLLVRGADSDVLSADVARRMLVSQPRARLVEVAGAGHTVPGDRPAEFLAALREFLDT